VVSGRGAGESLSVVVAALQDLAAQVYVMTADACKVVHVTAQALIIEIHQYYNFIRRHCKYYIIIQFNYDSHSVRARNYNY
jgi:soluble P-type ATPase